MSKARIFFILTTVVALAVPLAGMFDGH